MRFACFRQCRYALYMTAAETPLEVPPVIITYVSALSDCERQYIKDLVRAYNANMLEHNSAAPLQALSMTEFLFHPDRDSCVELVLEEVEFPYPPGNYVVMTDSSGELLNLVLSADFRILSSPTPENEPAIREAVDVLVQSFVALSEAMTFEDHLMGITSPQV